MEGANIAKGTLGLVATGGTITGGTLIANSVMGGDNTPTEPAKVKKPYSGYSLWDEFEEIKGENSVTVVVKNGADFAYQRTENNGTTTLFKTIDKVSDKSTRWANLAENHAWKNMLVPYLPVNENVWNEEIYKNRFQKKWKSKFANSDANTKFPNIVEYFKNSVGGFSSFVTKDEYDKKYLNAACNKIYSLWSKITAGSEEDDAVWDLCSFVKKGENLDFKTKTTSST